MHNRTKRFIRPQVECHVHETISQLHLAKTPAFQFKVSFKEQTCFVLPLGKVKKILYIGFRTATLNFQNLNTLSKVATYPANQNLITYKTNSLCLLNSKPLKLLLRVFLAGYTVSIVTYCATKMITKFTNDWAVF